MRRFSAAVLAFACLCAPSFAQTPPPNPVIQHYRAYQAALQNNDLPTAENEAEWALASSQQRDGDGGRTAVLALNLASVRLLNNDAANAIEPAQQALRLAQAGAVGVDARLAGLILGRAEMATSGRPGADRLNALLSAPLDGVAASEIYSAAYALGSWALTTRDFALARTAWRRAGESSEGSSYGREYGLAVARTGEGAAVVLQEIGEQGSGDIDRARAIEADGLFRQALDALRPVLLNAPVTDLPSAAERAAGEATAWRAVIRVKLRSDHGSTLPYDDDTPTLSDVPADVQCAVRTVRTPIEYPDHAQDRSQVGVVVLRLRFDESGQILNHIILANLGDPSFAHVIDMSSQHWHVVRRPDAAPNCRMSGRTVVVINFMMH